MDEDTVTIQVNTDEFAETPPESKRELEQALHKTQAAVYSTGTLKNLVCQWRSFLWFCAKYKITHWPIDKHELCLYAQFLAYSFKSAKSVRSYMYGVRTLHILTKVKPPNMADIEVRIMLKGLNKKLITPVKQAQPLTPDVLMDILAFLDLNKRADLLFWGSLLMGFFGMFRKSNLIPDRRDAFDPTRQLMRGHVQFREGIAIIQGTWTKTIQGREKVLEILIFPKENSPLCPVTVLKAILSKPGRSQHPLFGTHREVAFTYSQWQRKFRKLLKKAGYRESAFSSHSMRRGCRLGP